MTAVKSLPENAMFYLHASNKTENLLRQMAALIETAPLKSVFDSEYVLIQSQGMERMISQYMAKYFTSWCNYRFLLPVTFLQNIAEKLGMAVTPDGYERSFLTWRIEEKLRSISDPVYSPLWQYLTGENVDAKRFQLARQLANIFDQYQLMRPQMLGKWEKNISQSNDEAELWQMDLWNRLTEETDAGQHRGKLLYSVIAELRSSVTIEALPQRISVFGLHTIPPFFLDYLSALSNHCDVHLFLLSPCQRYWGDLRKQKNSERVDTSDLQHPLLLTLGRQGRDFQELLLEKVSFANEFTSYQDVYQQKSPTLLHHLQSDILHGKITSTKADFSADKSIRIAACHSKQRELAVLKDHILDLLDGNNELQLRDIVVMAPDIQEYGSLIPAVFNDIKHSIADRSLHKKNGYIAAFSDFLSLFPGRFGWAEVLGLLEKKEIFPAFGLSYADFEQLHQWTVSSGVRWGLSLDWRTKEGFPFAENSWQSGLERLLMGYAIDSNSEIQGIIPYSEIEGNDAHPLGGLCEFLDLLASADAQLQNKRTLQQWATILLEFVTLLFGKPEEREYLELLEILNNIEKYGEYNGQHISLSVVKNWIEASAGESRSASGFLKGQLTFCSMLPMRSIPFKAVCIIGLDYGVFPKNDFQATFDLMQKKAMIGDRSLRADDRYQFLEAILSARHSLYISYAGQSLADNSDLPPSVVVSELLELIQKNYGIKDKVEKHPLHGFSSRYFRSGSNFFSYDDVNLQIAKSLGEKSNTRDNWWQGSIPAPAQEVIELGDLLSFYSHPQQYFVEHCLGVYLSQMDKLPEETEAFEVKGLDKYITDQQIVESIINKEDPETLQKKLRLEANWPLAATGTLTFKEKTAELSLFTDALHGLALGEKLEDLDFRIKVGGYQLKGVINQRYENGLLLARYGSFRGKDLLKSWILHLAAQLDGRTAPVTWLVMKDEFFCFDSSNEGEVYLAALLHFYLEGNKQPSMLFVEPGLEYCRQKKAGKEETVSLDKAIKIYRNQMERGYQPYWSLLYGEQDVVKNRAYEFAEVVETIMIPPWSRSHG